MFFNEKIKDENEKPTSGRFPWGTNGNSDFDFIPLISNYIHEGCVVPKIDHVKFNDPATIIFWKDGSKTVVKAYEKFDPEKGMAMAIAKKAMGNKGSYYNKIRKWVDVYYEDLKENWNPFANEEALDRELYGYDKDDHLSEEELHELVETYPIETALKLIKARVDSKFDDDEDIDF